MADSVELRMSVTSIKRVDPYVQDILATSTHVALYEFNPEKNEWEKTETEGALFLYSRNGEPYNSLIIMNRLNTNNLIEPIVKDFDYQMQAPFLLYRNSKNKIFGIWFYNREECVKITYLLETLMERIKEQLNEKSKTKTNVDIFSMLSKAQEDFQKTPSKPEQTQPQFASTPRAPDVTSSVMDFFAKAVSKTNPQVPVTPGNGENLLQRLMSNPAHSVEHIEKQQRSVTPQDPRQKNPGDRRSVPILKPENGLNFMRGPSPRTSPLAAFLMQAPQTDDRELLASPLYETPQKLLPPKMFQTSAVAESKMKMVEPLTKNQMLQALTYLIKNDADFVTKLHEAYVKSITEMVNHSNSSSSLM